jgi:branched-chain amino acid transport system permease protein
MEFAVSSLLNGLIYGLLLFMVSAGLTLIFGLMGVLNFAHGSFYMLGAYMGYFLSSRIGFVPALFGAGAIVGGVGMLCERYLLQPVHREGHAHELLVTFGLLFVFDEIVKIVFGQFAVNYAVPASLNFEVFRLGNYGYSFYRLFIGLVAIVLFAALYALVRFTRAGLIVRAAVQRPLMVQVLGHNVPLVFMIVFACGAAMAGVAGAIAGALLTTSPTMSSDIGTLVFVIVVIGGLGSVGGALVASLLIGVFSTFAIGIDWTIADGMGLLGLRPIADRIGGILLTPLSTMSGVIPFALMLVVLLVRPAGLMGDRA